MVYLGIVMVLLLGLLAFVASKPAVFLIRRSQLIQATPDSIYPLINDLHQFNRWNPFAAGDASLRFDYSGPNSGVGATYDWNGCGKSGQGRMRIVETLAPSQVRMQLDFSRPFQAHNRVDFTLSAHGSATTVTWSMTGRNGFMQKLFGTLFNMDKMVGGEFTKGLNQLRTLAEG